MRYLHCLIASLCVGALSQAIAADPPAPTPTATSAPVQKSELAPVSAPPAAETQVKADAEAKAKADAEAKDKAVDKRLRAQGYKPVNHNGTLRYCRSEQALGSRFPTSVCGTPEELDFAEKNGKETVQRIQQMNSALPGGK
jgi:hypothetical protein